VSGLSFRAFDRGTALVEFDETALVIFTVIVITAAIGLAGGRRARARHGKHLPAPRFFAIRIRLRHHDGDLALVRAVRASAISLPQ